VDISIDVVFSLSPPSHHDNESNNQKLTIYFADGGSFLTEYFFLAAL